jgi:hypothetical protein
MGSEPRNSTRGGEEIAVLMELEMQVIPDGPPQSKFTELYNAHGV